MESAAEKTATLLFNSFADPESGKPQCALARVFKTHPYAHLDDDLQTYVRRTTPDQTFAAGTPCLTLLGTAGLQPGWNSRHLSASHRAIALPSLEVFERAPMISNLFQQLGCELEAVINPRTEIMLMNQRSFNVFFVGDARGSDLIPSQSNFVEPYGIRSVVGFGGWLNHGEVFAAVLFFQVTIDREVASLFSRLSLALRALLLQFEQSVFYSAPE
jgi:hypothetical protein